MGNFEVAAMPAVGLITHHLSTEGRRQRSLVTDPLHAVSPGLA